MSDPNIILQQLAKQITELEARRDDLIDRLPAHSIPPSMIAELDEIEEQITQAKLQMAELEEHK